MNEPNKEYIEYLNSLNSYNAKNKNAYSEKNIENDFYKSTSVEMGISKFIGTKIQEEDPQVIILSGQAGDGKTSIMYQVINLLAPSYQLKTNQNIFEIKGNNSSCTFVKDFSELSNAEKKAKLEELLNLPKKNEFAFIVANTGPLINTFGELFTEVEKESAKIELIDSIKTSNGKEKNICGYKIAVISMASIDNSYFAPKYLEKILDNELWIKCESCGKKEFCPIFHNTKLIRQNSQAVYEFLENHYIWLSENGTRLTIRSITEQLSYMIAGGLSCSAIKNVNNYKYLYTNLFFGLLGFQPDSNALKMNAIKAAFDCGYYFKKMGIDKNLIIKSDYSKIFSSEWAKIICEVEKSVDKKADLDKERDLFYAFLRRTYIFQNNSDSVQRTKDLRDIFSPNFEGYIKNRKTKTIISSKVKKPILDALSMIYTGTKMGTENKVAVTLNKKSGVLQTVQFVIGYLYVDDFDIKKVKSNDGQFNETGDIYYFYPAINDEILNIRLNLPLLDYFNNLQKGIIETDLDPLLSHGIESLKAQISEKVEKKKKSDQFELLILKNKGTTTKKIEICDKQISII